MRYYFAIIFALVAAVIYLLGVLTHQDVLSNAVSRFLPKNRVCGEATNTPNAENDTYTPTICPTTVKNVYATVTEAIYIPKYVQDTEAQAKLGGCETELNAERAENGNAKTEISRLASEAENQKKIAEGYYVLLNECRGL